MPREYTLDPTPASGRIDFERDLNPQQLAAVTAPPGPALILAGAGAGKTRTLVYRVAWLIDQGAPPDRILLLTFTNKAAREMMQRARDLVGAEIDALWGGTFHSVGLRILRRHAAVLGFPPQFTVADREDSRELLDALIAEAGAEAGGARFPKAEALGDFYSLAVNTGKPIGRLLAEDFAEWAPYGAAIAGLQDRYAERKREAGVMDFDDLLALWLRLIRTHDAARLWHQRKFQFVLVDEYQDINRLQGDLLDELTGPAGNLMAVGDDAQSIYSWRGADLGNILDFAKHRPTARVYPIVTNYRSTPEILAAANAALAANRRQFPKELQSTRPSGPKPAMVVSGDAREQAAFVCQRVADRLTAGIPPGELCVLYRSHFHALELQLELTRRQIPFWITSGIRFFEQAHIKDVAAHLRLAVNPADELAFKRLVKLLPGVGNRASERLWAAFRSALARLDAPPSQTPAAPRAASCLASISAQVPKRAASAWAAFAATMAQAEAPGMQSAPDKLIRLVIEAGYAEQLKADHDDASRRLEELDQLAGYASQFPNVADLLAQLALQSNVEAEAAGANRDAGPDERLRLSTIHQAKGLEFDTVFVIMLCDGFLPSTWGLKSEAGEEEERRLFYVALTRAKNELYLCHPLMRFGAGGGGMQSPSRFLREIPADLLDEWTLRPAWRFGSRRPSPEASDLEPEPEPGVDPDPDADVQAESNQPDDEPF